MTSRKSQTLTKLESRRAASAPAFPETPLCTTEFGGRLTAHSGALDLERAVSSAEMLSPMLSSLEKGEALGLEIVVGARGERVAVGLRGRASGHSPDELEARRARHTAMLATLIRSQLPGFTYRNLDPSDALPAMLSHGAIITPRGRQVITHRRGAGEPGPRPVADTGPSVLLPTLTLSPERITTAVDLLRARGVATALRLDLALEHFDAAALRLLGGLRAAIDNDGPRSMVEAMRHLALTVPDDALLTAFLNDGGGVRVTLSALSAEPLDIADRRMLCHALLGVEPGDASPSTELDLSNVFPRSFALGRLIGGLAGAAVNANRRAPVHYEMPRGDALALGHTKDGRHVVLSALDRALHVVTIGATGTGKSTLLLNQLAADILAGRGCLLLDPHGDLWEAARRLVPREREKDLLLCHLGEPEHHFTMNVLQGLGGDPSIERSATVNGLIRLFKNTLWPGVPEAFGPMFELYFRHALLLQMSAEHEKATILGVERIFQDEKYRRDLIERCDDQHVADFWTKTAARVTYHEIDIDNIAPYIICKLAPFTANRLLRPMLASESSSLDLQAAIRQGKIVLINLAKGIVGEGSARLVGSLLTMRLVASAQTQMRIPEADRRPFFAVLDEFQTYASEHVSEAIEETRKYRLRLTLACQSLGQVDGRANRADVGRSIVANVGNLIAFRLGVDDAGLLAPYFAPGYLPQDMMYLANHVAVGRLLSNGQAVRPIEFSTNPPPEAAREAA